MSSLSAHPLVRHWLAVDGSRLLLRTGKVDIGQRISTALIRIAAEETTLPMDRIAVAPVDTADAPDEGITSGSNSIQQSGAAIRQAAATARLEVLRIAQARLGAPVALRDGLVVAEGSNRTLALLDLLADLPPDLPADPDAPLLDGPPPPANPPQGMEGMVTGAHAFLHDFRVPGMLHARVVRPPHARCRLEGLDSEALARLHREGIEVIGDGAFLAVAASGEWQAVRAAARLFRAARWDGQGGLEEGEVFEMLRTRPRISLPVVDGRPVEAPVPPPIASATHSAEFRRPYTLHGALAPSAAFAQWADGHLHLTCHSQGIYPLRKTLSEALSLPEDAITIRFAPGSGCYGHNGADDAAFEAALIAMALPGKPVLLKWTREDEHRWEPLGPAALVHLSARLEDGRIAAFSAEAYSDTHRGRPRPGPDGAGPQRLLASRFREQALPPYTGQPNMNRHGGLHRNLDPIYAFAERRVVKHLVPGLPLRSSALRTLGATANVFAIESFMDDLAAETGADPVAFRMAHLEDLRAVAVLERLRALMADSPEGEETGRGIAYAQYKNAQTRVAAAADIAVSAEGVASIARLLLVADAGRIVDPDGLMAQLEGGAVQAVGWALFERAGWDRDGPTVSDWEGQKPIRFPSIPEIRIETIDRRDQPSVGVGEAACGPVVAAIANGIFAATGLRLHEMPFDRDTIVAAALSE